MDGFDQFPFGKSSLFRGELLVLESIMAKKHFRDLQSLSIVCVPANEEGLEKNKTRVTPPLTSRSIEHVPNKCTNSMHSVGTNLFQCTQ